MADGIHFADGLLAVTPWEFLVPPQNDLQSPRTVSQPKSPPKGKGELIALPATPSLSLDDAGTILEIEVQASQLLDYIDKLTSFADRACTAAFRQTETTRRIEENRFSEIADLRRLLEQQNTKLQQQEIALVRLEQQSKGQITELEMRLLQKEAQQAEEKQHHLLRSENAHLMNRIREAEPLTRERNDGRSDNLDEALGALNIKLAERDKTIQAKDARIKQIETDSRAKIQEIEQCLRDAEKNLRAHEEALKAKNTIIQATALKEAEMGNLIKRLSTECSKLSNQLQEKPQTFSPNQMSRIESRAKTKIWRRVIGRLQEDPQ
jgi:hypothetical protein